MIHIAFTKRYYSSRFTFLLRAIIFERIPFPQDLDGKSDTDGINRWFNAHCHPTPSKEKTVTSGIFNVLLRYLIYVSLELD